MILNEAKVVRQDRSEIKARVYVCMKLKKAAPIFRFMIFIIIFISEYLKQTL